MKNFFVISSMALLIGGGFYAFDNEPQKVEGKSESKVELIEKENILPNGKIKTIVTKDEASSKEIEVTLQFNEDLRKTDLDSYKEKNTTLINKLKNKEVEIPTTVTLTKAVPLNEFHELVNKYNLSIDNYNIEAVDKEGNALYIQGAPEDGSLIPADKLEEHLNGGKVVGVYTFQGKVKSKEVEKLAEDQQVFLADVTELALTEKFNKHKKSGEHLDVNITDVYRFINN